MAEKETNTVNEIERRRQSARDRINNKLERAKRPGAMVQVPNTPATYEMLYYVRGIDLALAELQRQVFQSKDMKKIEKAGGLVETAKKSLSEITKELVELAGIEYREYEPRYQPRQPRETR